MGKIELQTVISYSNMHNKRYSTLDPSQFQRHADVCERLGKSCNSIEEKQIMEKNGYEVPGGRGGLCIGCNLHRV